ncbi:MAG: hypothetical protein RLZ62_1835 [Bacteroidota bacterium]|jgi:hypothetical protein
MKKVNWWRITFFLLLAGMFVIQSCGMFKPRCNCPHF